MNSAVVGAPTLSKRRKNEEAHEENGVPRKKTRTRVSYSCSECHRRKQKCDRQQPCGHCVARKVPELCKGYTPGKNDTSDLSLRISRLERIIELALPGFGADSPPEHPSPPQHDQQFSRGTSPEDESKPLVPTGGTLVNGGAYYGNSALGSVTSAPIMEQLHTHILPPDEPSATDKLKTLVQEYGVPPHKLPELLQELPPRRMCDALIDYYFTSVNYTRYPIDEAAFRASYDSIIGNGLRVQPEDVRFLPLLFVVLAISARLAPDELITDERSRRLNSLRYYWSSRRSLLIAAAIQNDSFELVLARLLSARFLIFDRRVTECWSQLGAAVRTAQALGLHRDGAMLGLDPPQTEYRRRIWSYLYHADRTQALILGRPHAIQDEYTSTQPPVNLDESGPGTARIVPLTTPTPWTFIVLRHSLAVIIGHIVHHFQQVRSHNAYNDVIALDEELQRFVTSLPPHYALDEPDTSLDHSHPYIPVHRFIIITEVFFVRISLHRPYILRKLHSDRYQLSRKACFDSAKRDYRIRQAFKRNMPPNVLRSLGGAYREFQAAMIAGIALMLNNTGSEAEEMHEILDGFMKDHEDLPEVDPTTMRELKIIEFLKRKAAAQTTNPLDVAHAQVNAGLMGNESGGKRPLAGIIAANGIVPMPFFGMGLQQPMYQATPSPSSPDQNVNSPRGRHSRGAGSVGSGLTPVEEAQQLLDVWCSSVINSGGAVSQEQPSMEISNANWGSAPTPGFGSGFAVEGMGDPMQAMGNYESDWSYWETIATAINRGGPAAS